MQTLDRWLRVSLIGMAGFAAIYLIFFSKSPEPIGDGLSRDSIVALEDQARQQSMVISPQARQSSPVTSSEGAESSEKRRRRTEKRSEQGDSAEQANADEKLAQIVSLVDGGQWQQAELALQELLTQNPRHEMALVEMAMLQLIDKRDPEAGRVYLERAAIVNPNNDAIINELLAVYEETGNIEQGIDFLQSVPEIDRQNGVIDYGIANALLQSGRPEDALVYYQRAMERSGYDDVRLREETADAYFESGRYHEAIDLYETTLDQVTDLDKKRHMQIKLATTYYQQNDIEAAQEILRSMLDANPEDDLVAQLLKELQTGRM